MTEGAGKTRYRVGSSGEEPLPAHHDPIAERRSPTSRVALVVWARLFVWSSRACSRVYSRVLVRPWRARERQCVGVGVAGRGRPGP